MRVFRLSPSLILDLCRPLRAYAIVDAGGGVCCRAFHHILALEAFFPVCVWTRFVLPRERIMNTLTQNDTFTILLAAYDRVQAKCARKIIIKRNSSAANGTKKKEP